MEKGTRNGPARSNNVPDHTASHRINEISIKWPQRMTKEEEVAVIEQLASGTNSDEARSALIERNVRLVGYVVKNIKAPGVEEDDLVSIGFLGLTKAALSFRPERQVKFASYAVCCIRNEILVYMHHTRNQRSEISLDEPLTVDENGNELLLSDVLSDDEDSIEQHIEKQDEYNTVRNAVMSLPARDREIIEMRYGFNGKGEHTQKYIGGILGIGQTYCSRLEKKILNKLRKKISTYYLNT